MDTEQSPPPQQERFQPIEDHSVLGRYVSHHPSRREVLLFRGGLAYTAVVMGLNLIFINDESTVVEYGLPIVFVMCALVVFWYIAHYWNREVILYQNGFSYRQGSQQGEFYYAEIAALKPNVQRATYFGVFTRTNFKYLLKTQLDESLLITNLYSDVEKLTDRLERFIIRDRLPLIQDEIGRGIIVDFGDGLRVSNMGVEYDGRELFWHEFVGYKAKQGKLHIQSKTDDAWAEIALDTIDNLLLLVAFLKTRRTEATPQETA